MTAMSQYPLMIRPVSERVSPFLVEEDAPLSNVMIFPPNFCMAASNANRVRVLGSKNRLARIFPRARSKMEDDVL